MLTPGKLILAVPSNDTPPIFLAVCNFVALLALPENAPLNVVALAVPPILKSPESVVLPVTLSTKNLSVVPLLTAKSASTSTVPLNSLFPVTVKLPPSVVAPLLTFNVPVDFISIPNPFSNCKSPAPLFHEAVAPLPLTLPPVMFKLPVSVNPNGAHAAPV